jgi:dipeptidyl aminopeptidase/acylaminoacyl peptidase
LWWEGDTLAALRSGARTPQQVVVYNMSNAVEPQRTVLVKPADSQWFTDEIDAELVEPSLHTADSGDLFVPYRLYRAAKPNYGLIVWVHGGPTDQWNITFRPRLAYWLSRGWSICVVDHRGTTGHGREFAQALEGHWGDYDAVDTAAVIAQVQRTFGYRPGRTVLMGGSAGGLTALNAISINPTLVSAAVLSYPVVDLAELMRGDDPFETHYMPALIGASDDSDPMLWNRSPLSRAHRLVNTRILVFHGDQDHSVPLIHSERLRDVVAAAGGHVQLEVMPGEGHGFKDTLNVIREYSLSEEFLRQCFS